MFHLNIMIGSFTQLLSGLFGNDSIIATGVNFIHLELMSSDTLQMLNDFQKSDKTFAARLAYAIDHSVQLWIGHCQENSNYNSINRDFLFELVADILSDLKKQKFHTHLPNTLSKLVSAAFPSSEETVQVTPGGGVGSSGGGAKKRKKGNESSPGSDSNGAKSNKPGNNAETISTWLMPNGVKSREAVRRTFAAHLGTCPTFSDPTSGEETAYCITFQATGKCHRGCKFAHATPTVGSTDYKKLDGYFKKVYKAEAKNLKKKFVSDKDSSTDVIVAAMTSDDSGE